MQASDFDYELPEELIAQVPLSDRTNARMMVLDRAEGSISHSGVNSVSEYLQPGDLMVFNNTKVFPARTLGVREDTGGRVELVFVRQIDEETESSGRSVSKWLCIFGSGSKTRAGQRLSLCDGKIHAELCEVLDQGHVVALVDAAEPIMPLLERVGEIPLPPYIGRDVTDADKARYQTVYASQVGAVAAPTAGLHFTDELLGHLAAKGVERCEITLHVGPGTFLPVKVDNVEEHVMHAERYSVGQEAVDAICAAKERGGRIVAVGTTTVRTLEGLWAERGAIEATTGETDIFIYPEYEFGVVDALLTNFHLPKSTLLMMVSAFAGKEFVRRAYEDAVSNSYRFYSYGDCMLII